MSKQSKIKKQNSLDLAMSNLNSNEYFFVFDYKGITANDFFALRKTLFEETGDKVTILKNSMAKLLLKNEKLNVDQSIFSGQKAIIFTSKVISVATILKSAISSKKISSVVYTDKVEVHDEGSVVKLGEFKNEDGLKSALLMLLKEPASRLARLLNQKCSG